ncbi:prephenate dehydrogenase [Enemella evansiae]|uniref:prephenate dehydrogenase n=1 Tax=Enemella evansiae TaxID=2016499 RepID=UPI000B95F80B|nr:prephenate dehydrogenase [Enemella evansiae]OYN98336.1 prephenate dehydrogenase [Enemella evansiae]
MSDEPDPFSGSDFGPVLIIGAGLVGASVGCALTEAGIEVHLRDQVPSHARVAAGRGAGSVEPIDPEAVALVVVAVPPRVLAPVVSAALDEFGNAVVTDVGSVKGSVLRDLAARGLELRRYVGSHPMAGSHLAGPVTARPDLFTDRTWVIAPHATATPGAIETVTRLATISGANPVVMDAEEHDLAVAAVSHLPHAVSAMLAAGLTETKPAHLQLAGQGVRDVTRIAAGDPDLWDQILTANAPAVADQLAALSTRLGELAERLAEQRPVDDLLATGVAGTRAIPGKHGRAQTEYARLIIEIPDAPGSLARFFTDAGAAGVNVEDISIEHDPVREVGWLQVSVRPELAPDFSAAMSDRGWHLHEG